MWDGFAGALIGALIGGAVAAAIAWRVVVETQKGDRRRADESAEAGDAARTVQYQIEVLRSLSMQWEAAGPNGPYNTPGIMADLFALPPGMLPGTRTQMGLFAPMNTALKTAEAFSRISVHDAVRFEIASAMSDLTGGGLEGWHQIQQRRS